MKHRIAILGIMVVFLFPLLISPASNTFAQASPPVSVTVTIMRIIEVSCDDGAFTKCPDDYYTKVNIAGQGFQRSPGTYEDEGDVSPYWTFTRQVTPSSNLVLIDIEVWDEDNASGDDILDISSGDRALHLALDLNTGSWGGEVPQNVGFSQGAHAKVLFDISVGSDGDVDDDGIPDGVERFGVRDANGNIVTDMAAMGADPCRKTIAVEIDFMSGAPDGHTHRPQGAAIAEVVAAFNAAPVPAVTACPYAGFPKQASGVNFIADVDDALPEQATLAWGAGAEAVRNANFDPARRPYFHYSLWVHNQPSSKPGVVNTSSGLCCSDSGKDALVSLGSWANQVGTVRDQSGSLMHELGHALGFGHGGGDNINCKPNYLSVMSYALQTTGIPDPTLASNNIDLDGNGTLDAKLRLDYSRADLPDLNEAALVEANGIGDGTDLATWSADGGTNIQTAPGNGPIDWDVDSPPNPSETVAVDTNNLGFFDCGQDANGNPAPSPGQLLTGYDDWANLKYRAAMSPNAGFAPVAAHRDLDSQAAAILKQRLAAIKPVTTLTTTGGAPGQNGWLVTPVIVTLSARDPLGDAVDHIEYSFDNLNWTHYSVPFVVPEGITTVYYRSQDTSGYLEDTKQQTFKIDTIPPTSTIKVDGTLGLNGWFTSAVQVTLSAADSTSGVNWIEWSVNNGQTWQLYTGPFIYAQEGVSQLLVRAIDNAGNVETAHQREIKIDTRPPVVNVSTDKSEYTRIESFVVHYQVYDPQPGSGIDIVEARLGDQVVTLGQTIDLFWYDLGTYTLIVSATDRAGWETVNQASFDLIATIESMIATTDRLCAMKEIDNRGICNALTQKLQNALRKRDEGQTRVAVNMLHAFINSVEAQYGKHISDRGARLLIMDAQYVTERLSGEVMLSTLYGGRLHIMPGLWADLAPPHVSVVVKVNLVSANGTPLGYPYRVSEAFKIAQFIPSANAGANLIAVSDPTPLATTFTLDPRLTTKQGLAQSAELFKLIQGEWIEVPGNWTNGKLRIAVSDDLAGQDYALFSGGLKLYLPLID